MVVLGPVRVHESLLLVAVAREEIGPCVQIQGAVMVAEEVVSSIKSVKSEVIGEDTCCMVLTPDEFMILLGTLALNIKIDDTLVYIVASDVQLCDEAIEMLPAEVLIDPALILAPIV